MESMYDVFTAIRDDEGDHVGTMEACLDPTVAKLSPSLERKVLTGIATAAAVAIFLNTGADVGINAADVVDGVDFAVDETVGTTLVDATIAGAAGLASQMGSDMDEVELAGQLMPEVRRLLTEVAAIFSRVL